MNDRPFDVERTTAPAEEQRAGISLCMIVKNEERNLARCLESARGVVDEIVVVDTGSTDSTMEIAAAFGARVERHPWRDSFGAAKNIALGLASSTWILVLDADEELDVDSRTRLREVVLSTHADALEVWVRSGSGPGDLSAFTDSAQVRLLRAGRGYAYEGDIHEQIVFSIGRAGGRIARTDLRVIHHGYETATVQGEQDRLARNLTLLETAVASKPDDPYLLTKLGGTYLRVGRFDLAERWLSQVVTAHDFRTSERSYLHDALRGLASIASARQDYAGAAQLAEASLSFDDPALPDLDAMLMLAQATLGLAGACLEPGALERADEEPSGAPAKGLIDDAAGTLQRILADDRLREDQRPDLERWLGHCRALALEVQRKDFQREGMRKAAAVLEEMLTCADVAAALDRLGPALDQNVVTLVLANACAARSDGQLELAGLLENLAEHVTWRIGNARPLVAATRGLAG